MGEKIGKKVRRRQPGRERNGGTGMDAKEKAGKEARDEWERKLPFS